MRPQGTSGGLRRIGRASLLQRRFDCPQCRPRTWYVGEKARPSGLAVIWRLCCLDLDQCDVDPMQLTWNASQPGMAAAPPANKVVAVPSITTAPSKIVTICLFIVLSYLLQGLRRGMGAMSIFAKYLV